MSAKSGKKYKVCKKCNKLLLFSEFWKDNSSKDGKKSNCILCCKQKWNEEPGRPRAGRTYVEPTEKLCRGCNVVLPIDSFSIRTERRNGRRSRCRQCCARTYKEYAEKNPGRSRRSNLKSKYGISEEQYFDMLSKQGDKCGLCTNMESGSATSPWMHVDHNHVTGEIRGLLCHNCNIAIGMIEKNNIDLDLIRKWIEK